MNWLTGCFDAHKTELIFSFYPELAAASGGSALSR